MTSPYLNRPLRTRQAALTDLLRNQLQCCETTVTALQALLFDLAGEIPMHRDAYDRCEELREVLDAIHSDYLAHIERAVKAVAECDEDVRERVG